MSGGSYEYAYHHVQEFSEELQRNCKGDPLRTAFVKHLELLIEVEAEDLRG